MSPALFYYIYIGTLICIRDCTTSTCTKFSMSFIYSFLARVMVALLASPPRLEAGASTYTYTAVYTTVVYMIRLYSGSYIKGGGATKGYLSV